MSAEFPYQEIRSLLLEHLAKNEKGQFSGAVQGAIELAKKHGLYSGGAGNIRRIGGANYDLGRGDMDRVPEAVRQLFWQLLVQGILVFGHNDLNPNWPLYRVTEYGKQVLAQEGIKPYDPDGFLNEFQQKNPNADSIVGDYLDEAVRCFNSGCFKATAVMLGCASEQLILVLHEAYENAITDSAKKKAFQKSYRWTISSKFNSLREGLERMIETKQLLKELGDAVRSDLVSGFELIRRIRNSAGHPELPGEIRRETVYLNLTIFPEYTSQILKLVEHLKTNPAKV